MNSRTFRYILLPLGGLIILIVMLTVSLTTFAQDDQPPTAGPSVIISEAGCELYHVNAPSANVYTCAGHSCGVVTPLVYNTEICIRGNADNNFLSIDLNTSDPASPLYYISRAEVAPGRAGQTNAPSNCFSYLVNADPAIVYQCAGFDCPAIGSMGFENWVCGQNYGGQYAGWIYARDSDSGLRGWLRATDLIPGRNNPNQPPDGSLGPTPGFAPPTGGAVVVPPKPTITPAPGTLTLTPMPICQQYHVTAVRANVRTCAGEDCPVVERIEQNESVCIRGMMQNTEWFYIDLSPEETASELYAISRSVVSPGSEPIGVLRPFCEIYEVASSVRALARQCPSVTCPALDALDTGAWICVFGYGGEYEEWLQADIPNGARNVWVHGAALKSRTDLEGATPTPLGTEAAYVASQTPFINPDATLPPPLDVVEVASVPQCQPFLVNVASAAVRECASTGCANKGLLQRGAEVCVLGVNPENSNWYVVDLTPSDPSDQNVYIGQTVLSPLLQVVTATPSTTPTDAPTETPTVTVDPNLSPTPILTETARPTIQPIFTLTPAGSLVAPTLAPTQTDPLFGVPIGPLTSHEITLAGLRVRNIELLSPLGSTQFRFRVPDNWTPEGSNILYLNFEYFEQSLNLTEDEGVQDALIATLEVLMDGDLISTVALDKSVIGSQVLPVPLPVDRLQDTRNRAHTITVRFRAEDHCQFNSQARVFIRSDQSYMHFEYRENSPILNLALYPRPLSNTLLPNQTETVVMVLPSEANDTNLDASARVSAGLGLLTGNSVELQIVSDETVTEAQLKNFNLLLVGTPQDNSIIRDFYERNAFPTQLNEDGGLSVDGVPIADDAGVVQIITNPENPLRGVVTATGQSEEGLLKAAQALAGPPSIMGIGGPVTIISDVRPASSLAQSVFNVDFTLAALGIDNIILSGIGIQVAEIPFTIPSGQRLTEEASIEIFYNYSEVLATGASTVNILLNGEIPIASRVLDANAGTGPFSLKGLIPPTGIVPGETNTITITVDTKGDWSCSPPNDSIAWFTISRDSKLHLPIVAAGVTSEKPLVQQFPFPFNDRRDLRDLWINLPDEPTQQDIDQMIRVLSVLGAATVGGEGFAPRVNVGDLPAGTDLAAYNFIVIGRNTTNTLLKTLNPNLPQPFAPDTDQLQQVLDDVTYVLPPGYEVGVLQTIISPWEPTRRVLVITGTGEVGQKAAADALTSGQYSRTDFSGDVVFVSANSIYPINTASLENPAEIFSEGINGLETSSALDASLTPFPEGLDSVTVTPGPTQTPTITRTPSQTPSPTSLFTTTPTIATATPIPTFAPLSDDELGGVEVATPEWVNLLGIITVIVLAVVFIYGLASLLRRSRG